MLQIRTFFIPVLVSLVIHAGVLVLLGFNWNSQNPARKIERPNFVKAQLVELKEKAPKKVAKKKTKKVDLTKRRLEQQRQKKLAEQKKQAALKKKQEDAKRKKEEERKRKEELAKKEAEARAREQELRRLQMQQELEQVIAEEEQLLAEVEYENEAQSYVSAITQRIERNWSRPPSARTGMQCELLIQLVPTGQVVEVNIIKSSGNAAFDRSAEQAVKKVDRFPEIREMPPEVFERYYRKLRLLFNPQDLRQ